MALKSYYFTNRPGGTITPSAYYVCDDFTDQPTTANPGDLSFIINNATIYVMASNGVTWVEVSASQVDMSYVAYTNANNNFTAEQKISGANPSLYIIDNSQPANLRWFRIMNQSQQLRFYRQDDGESGWLDCMHLDRSGNMNVAGTVTTAANAVISGYQTVAAYSQVTGGIGIGSAANTRVHIGPVYNGSYPAFRNTLTANPLGLPMTDCVTGDSGNYAGIRASNFISIGVYNNLADLTCGATNFTAGVYISAGVLTVLSGQIQFPAAQNNSSNANCLDDYEEGTFNLTDASGYGWSLGSGAYVKVGKMCTVRMQAIWPAQAAGQTANFYALPFVNDGGNQALVQGYCAAAGIGGAAGGGLHFWAQGGASTIQPLYNSAAVTDGQMSSANVALCGSYLTNS